MLCVLWYFDRRTELRCRQWVTDSALRISFSASFDRRFSPQDLCGGTTLWSWVSLAAKGEIQAMLVIHGV